MTLNEYISALFQKLARTPPAADWEPSSDPGPKETPTPEESETLLREFINDLRGE